MKFPLKLFDFVKKEAELRPSDEATCWCHQCKRKVKPDYAQIIKREIKPGSHRFFLTGICSNCCNRVSAIVKNSEVRD